MLFVVFQGTFRTLVRVESLSLNKTNKTGDFLCVRFIDAILTGERNESFLDYIDAMDMLDIRQQSWCSQLTAHGCPTEGNFKRQFHQEMNQNIICNNV